MAAVKRKGREVEGYSSVPGVDVLDYRFEPVKFVRCHTEEGEPPEAGLQVHPPLQPQPLHLH